jgi:two-component system nitrogen regulation response regulator NtrX
VRELKLLAPVVTNLVGKSPAINQLRNQIEKVAPTNSRILIVGSSGSGKELTARTIHMRSNRASGPFVVINAAAMLPEHMEVELFGTEANGAHGRKVGALEEAHGGTLFVDEIADMPRETQNKILRVLVDQTFQRVGSTSKVSVDVRIISSTGRDIEAEVAAGKFREDLYHRLSVVPLRVPPLAERREDRSSFNTSWIIFPTRPVCRSAASRRTRWRYCSRTTGRATSGNCATTSNGS